ncbi:AMP-binding protein [Rhodococcus spelaei]|uniref:AMP-binding protein n=1 Tax=Rhodococcus spelaei TaxID=2546320 RepID=A0A541BQN9_9NOCA|nr:AMP-binding protein [Rhodococcus spelaei]TQF74647.1 AMP-binding protein [Rhodococcus spelaei]
MTPTPAPATVWSVLSESARRNADWEAVADCGERLTYGELAAAASRAGRAMAAAGVVHGDRVCLWAPNSARWAVVALGAHSIGAVVVPINTRASGDEAAVHLRRTRSRMLFVDNGFLGTGYASLLWTVAGPPAGDRPARDLPDLRHIVDLHNGAAGPVTGWSEFLSGADRPLRLDLRSSRRHSPATTGGVAYVMSTSGSAGAAKGVVLRHGQVVRVYRALAQRLGIGAGDRILGVNPLSHSFGLNAGLLAALVVGGCYVPVDVFDPAAVLDRIEAERITVVSGPPTLFTDLIAASARRGRLDPAPRLAVTGAATVSTRLLEDIRARLGIPFVATGYGLTEAAGTVTAQYPRADEVRTLAAPPLPGVRIRIVDRAGTDLAPGEAGEVLIHGYNVMTGYFEDETATGAALDDEGWLHTGDIGVLDETGALRVVDRIGEMFIVGGFNVYPAEVEQALIRHPAVAEVAVVGAPDERLGERAIAFVVAAPGRAVDEDELREHCRRLLAGYKVPARVVTLGELPRTPSGKSDRNALRAVVRLRSAQTP